MSLSPHLLNEAMCVYVQTVSMRDRLEGHIINRRLEAHRQEIVGELEAALKTAEDHAGNDPNGVPWTEARSFAGV